MSFLLFIVVVFSIIINGIVASVSVGSTNSTTFLSKTNPFKYSNIKNLIVFGDSLSSDETNFADMSYTGENRSLGENWPIKLSKLHNMTLWNFAISGSVIDPDIVPRRDFPVTYINQYRYFMERMPKDRLYSKEWNSNDTLFAYWLGTNDLYNLNRTIYPSESIPSIIDLIVKVFFTSIKGVYDTGARNFLFFNVQSIDDLPNHVNITKPFYDPDVDCYNTILQSYSKTFSQQYNDTNLIIYNIKDEIRYLMDHYQDYNFTSPVEVWWNNKEKSVESYLWVDELHTTHFTNDIFTRDLDHLLQSLESPHHRRHH